MFRAQTAVPDSRPSFVGKRPVTLGEFPRPKAALAAALCAQESNRDILRVRDRAANGNDFAAALTHNGTQAHEGYHLTAVAEAALPSGDIPWIEAQVGRLSERRQIWPWCSLGQKTW